ncbi:MAG: primosomal protein N' [Vicinamibacterales bacterium]
MPAAPSHRGGGPAAPAARAVAVAVPVPYLDALTYLVPDGTATPASGVRVRVPLGKRTVVGTVLASVSVAPGVEAKPILDVLDAEPFVPPAVVELCQWVADYYVAGVGDAIAVAQPPGSRRRESAFRTVRVVHATAFGLDTARAGGGGLTAKQRVALDEVAGAPGGLPSRALKDRGVTPAVVAKLVSAGLAVVRTERDDRDPLAGQPAAAGAEPLDLTADQTSALDTLRVLAATGEFRAAVLYGVTGSGKTEVYVRLAASVVAAGRRVLVLVPEIALTPSAVSRFHRAFGGRVAVQHSGLSDGERHDQWHRIRRGDVDVVIGTRSAVFAPVDRLGLVIVDEEHDSSYKQEESPRYHGRDVAVMRASREGALVVLGSATPSLESFRNADTGRYARVALDRRVLDRPLASVRIVDMREVYADEGPDVVISPALAEAIGVRLERGEQSLVLLNRRGWATSVFCRQCGTPMECPHCSVSLTVHGGRRRAATATEAGAAEAVPGRGVSPERVRGAKARCHYCDYTVPVPPQCPRCAAPYMEQAGFGTERVEAEVRRLFPDARVGRIDRDAIRKRGTLATLLAQFAAGEIDVLVGTQMIAKGHDFPRVTLVGVISADVGLGLPDFRAAERTFQLLTQVAGRAGRGERVGEAIIQTLNPAHYSVELACRQDYPAFYEKEVAYRRAMQYPPLFALINVIVRGPTEAEAMGGAQQLARGLQPAQGFLVLGPAPAPLGRLRGEHRVQLFLKGPKRTEMRNALRRALDALPALRRRVTVDVDPMSVL